MEQRLIDAQTLSSISNIVIELTRIKQREVPHLVIENFAVELFAKLLLAYWYPERFLSDTDGYIFENNKPVVSANN